MENSFPMVAKTFQGLENVLRDELIALGAENVETGLRMVSFDGDLELMYKANLCCRTALRILKPIIKFTANDPDELYDQVRDIEWEKYMTPDSTFAIDSTVNSAEFTHSKYVTYRVKDGIVDHFTDICGKRPSIRLQGADLMLNVHILDSRVTISLDSSGEPLSKRGYRVEQTDAPINEALAAGIIMMTGWHGETDFVDPMCGSGTFLIEAALIAGNINPGIYREHFAFEKWPDFDKDLFESLYNDDSAERDITCKISGGDIDPEAVNITRKNIKAARLDSNIEVVCKPMQEWDMSESDGGVLITNPPYGERLRPENMETLYRQLGETLKFHFQGWNAWILGYKDEHFAAIGLKPSVKYPILNGALECSLREYVLFSGKYNDFRAEGGSVSNKEFNREARHHTRRLSDEEWEKEALPARNKDSKRSSRKDSKSDFKPKAGKNFGKDSKRDFKRDFDRDAKYGFDRKFDRNSKRDSDRKFDRDAKSGAKKDFKRTDRNPKAPVRDNSPRQVYDRGPRISEENTTFSSPVFMRTRRVWKKKSSDTPEED